MTKKHQSIKVVKIPLKRSSIFDRPQVFPRMPRLYLELIENKAKIKQDLVNKEYIPYNSNPSNNSNPSDSLELRKSSPHQPKKYDDYIENSGNGDKKFKSRLDRLLSDDEDSISVDSVASSISDLSIVEKKKDYKKKHNNYDSDDSDISVESIKSIKSIDSVDSLNSGNSSNSSNSSDSGDLSLRLKQLLNEDSASESVINSPKLNNRSSNIDNISENDKYSRHRNRHGHSISHKGPKGSAPTLKELETQGGYIPRKELRDINQSSLTEQQEEDSKREYLFKFDLLRKSYPNSIIPEYSIHTDYNTMQKSYSDSVRRLSLDSSVENYKTYLMYGFMGCEFLFGNFLGFDMQGFTQQQLTSMNSYEKLLIELGEKSYVPTGSKWPVELRLLFMIIMNAAFFIISKMIMKKTGANLIGMLNNMNSSPNSTDSNQRKRRMRGPNIDIGDIPDIDSNTFKETK